MICPKCFDKKRDCGCDREPVPVDDQRMWGELFVQPIAAQMIRRGVGELSIKIVDGVAKFDLVPVPPPVVVTETIMAPCRCGSTDVKLQGNGIGDYYVECQACHARSNQYRCEAQEHAIERWNKRFMEGDDLEG